VTSHVETAVLPPRPPPDPKLPALINLLDEEQAVELLRRTFGLDASSLQVVALRYKPGRRLILEWRVRLSGRSETVTAVLDPKADLAQRARAPEIAYDGRLHCLLQCWPHDAELPALSLPPGELAGRLGVEPRAVHVERLGYKPFARATLRLGAHVVKLYASVEKWQQAAHGLERVTRAGLTPATLEGAAPALKATMQRFVAGDPPDGGEVDAQAGALLRRLHELPVRDSPRRTSDRRLEESLRTARIVETICPALADRVSSLGDELARRTPEIDALALSHGDFEPGQLVAVDGELALVDVDDLCSAPAADDLARYAAHAVRGSDDDESRLESVAERLVAGYGELPEAFEWYLSASILARAAAPFRSQRPDWPRRVEAFVTAAERAEERA